MQKEERVVVDKDWTEGVFILPEQVSEAEIVSITLGTSASSPSSFHPPPPAKFSCLWHGHTLAELISATPRYGSWLTDSQVVKDGSLRAAIPLDPVFPFLEILHSSRNKVPPPPFHLIGSQQKDSDGRFVALEQILDAAPAAERRVLAALPLASLRGVCEVKSTPLRNHQSVTPA
jgi:hypothetical protein